uniref:suppressor of cytokine signaling 2 isoform X2 n=1 Tax=Nyctereutes procyonoides TaxID=34880 RepID=UPI002443FC41|nr:suppressor of cytokine signaling 2 isoform X2 [Nyctereutes procyonoides]
MTLRCLEPSGNGAEGTPSQWGPAGPAEEPTPEAARLAKALRELSHTGWYWGNMTVNEAKEKLKEAPEGTFLIRDSSHSDYLLTISVKTSAGPTNLRIEYQDGKFRLDSIICVKSKLKQFDSVVHLIDYYVQMCKDKRTGPEAPRNGTVHLYLTKPLYTSAPPLQHLCRLTINKCTGTVWGLPLPTRLKDYLEEYKFQGPLNPARVLQHKEQPAEGSGPLLPDFFYLFMRDTERSRDTGRGRSRLHAGSPTRDSIPGPRGHALSGRYTLNH